MDPLNDTQAASTAHHAYQARDTSSSQDKPHDQDSEPASAQTAAAASSCASLPFELIVEILRYLSTSDAASSARVCSTWYAASKDVRIWRHLSFTRFNFMNYPQKESRAQLQNLVKSFSAKSGNTVESVDFHNLPHQAIQLLAEELIASDQSIKAIRGSLTRTAPLRISDLARAVAALAKRCRQLQTLELQFLLWEGLDLVFKGEASVSRPKHIRLSLAHPFNTLPTTGILNHVAALEIRHAHMSLSRDDGRMLMATGVLEELSTTHSGIERLTVHGLWERSPCPSFSAPSLTFLDLSFSHGSVTRLPLEAPKLRELVIDGRLLSKLSLALTANLSALTLRIVGTSYERESAKLFGVDRVTSHQGSLKLVVSNPYAERVLELLSEDFTWPGLKQVEIQIERFTVPFLLSVMAARVAGARGASKEQYLETINKAWIRITNAMLESDSELVAQAPQIMAEALALQRDTGMPTLCSPVDWTLIIVGDFPQIILDWLSEQPNVTVARA